MSHFIGLFQAPGLTNLTIVFKSAFPARPSYLLFPQQWSLANRTFLHLRSQKPESSPRGSQEIKQRPGGVQQAPSARIKGQTPLPHTYTLRSAPPLRKPKRLHRRRRRVWRVPIESVCPTGSGAPAPLQRTPTSPSVSPLSTPTRTRGGGAPCMHLTPRPHI